MKNRPIFLEFYGLPGSGKSTVSHMAASSLREKGVKVSEPTYVSDHDYSWFIRKLYKTAMSFIFMVLHPLQFANLVRFVNSFCEKKTGIFTHLFNIAPKMMIYDHLSTDFVIFDEGLIQSSISLVDSSKKNLDAGFKLFDICKKQTVIKIYLKISKEEALKRLDKRKTNDSRIEKMQSASDKLSEMAKLERIFENQESSLTIDIDSCGNVNNHVDIILQYLNSLR